VPYAKDGENGELQKVTDYATFFPDNFTGFTFESEPCNVCEIPNIRKPDGSGYNNIQEQYDSSSNKCKFNISGVIPEAYNVYIGKYGDAVTESVPSSISMDTTSQTNTDSINANCDDYKKCVAQCDKFK
jgi:hypothetical protein